MKPVNRFLAGIGVCLALIVSSHLRAEEASQKNYRYGVVENKSNFPINLRILNKSGKEEVCSLEANGMVVVPEGTKAVEAYYHERHPFSWSDRLDVDVYRSPGSEPTKKVPGFGDTVEFEEPTGFFYPSNLEADYPARILPGAIHPDDREEAGLRMLKHKEARVRAEGASELGAVKSAKAAEPLLAAFRDEDYNVRRAAGKALGDAGDASAVAPLLKNMETGNRPLMGPSVVALGKLGDERATEPLLKALKSDAIDYYTVTNTLQELGRKNSLPSLRKALQDENPYVRSAAVTALGFAEDRDSVGALGEIMRKGDSDLAQKAAKALARIGGDDAVSALKEALGNDNEFVRASAQYALRSAAGDRAPDIFNDVVKNGPENARIEAVNGLVGTGKKKGAVEALKGALKDDSPKVRAAAAQALGPLGSEDAVDALKEALSDSSTDVRRGAINALGEIGSAKGAGALQPLLNDPDPAIREDAERGLKMIAASTEERKRLKREADIKARDPELMKLNEEYMTEKKKVEELEKASPDSEEAKARRRKMDGLEKQFKERADRERAKDGEKWIDKYRDEKDRLAGGLLEDNKSRVSKLKDARGAQQGKLKKLEEQYQGLKETRKVEPWEERLTNEQRNFREQFVKENGEREKWTPDQRKAYEKGFDELTDAARKQWEKDKQDEAENNRMLGTTIKDLADGRAELNGMDEEIGQLEEKVAEEERESEGLGGWYPEGTSPTLEPEMPKPEKKGLDKWDKLDLGTPSVFQPKAPEELASHTCTLFKALDEINEMTREIDWAMTKHERVLQNPRFMACYYVNRGGLPEDQLGKGVMRFSESGELNDFPEWLTHELASASDIPYGGPVLPGLSNGHGSYLRIDEMKSKLMRSVDFLKNNSEYYQKNPPLAEMQHLRNLMDEWRRVVVAYHDILDQFLANTARWTVLGRHYGDVVYKEKRDEIEKKYPNRDKDRIQQAKYEVDMKNLEQWKEELKKEAETYGEKFHELDKKLSANYAIKLPGNLEEEFGPRRALLKRNQDYMDKSEQLKKRGLSKKDAKALQTELGQLKKQIEQVIKDEEKKYGGTWKDRYRDYTTGELPGGFLQDNALDKFRRLGADKGAGPAGAKREPLPEDPFYKFLGGCC